jgi:cell division protein FtsW
VKLRHEHAILILSIALLVIGLGMVFSASHELARSKFGDAFFFLKRQMFRAFIGMVLLLLVSQIDFRTWRRFARPGLVAACGALAVVFLFNAIRGARGWVHVFGATVQPVEFARLALILLVAAEVARLGPRIRSLRHGLLPLSAVIGVVLLLIVKQPDFGSAMALSLICGTMLFVGGARLTHLGGAGVILLSGAALLAWRFPHVRTRFLGFLSPDSHATAGAYQSLQSVLSIGSGGLFGKGLGQGYAKYGYLPDPHTDFIFSVMGEELGFAGCALVLVLFLMLVGRAIRVARAHEDPFARLLAVGIAMSMFWYVAINLLVAVRLFPVTGLPLPLVSYGGSALVSHLFELGILRNLARQAEAAELRPYRRWPERAPHTVEALL